MDEQPVGEIPEKRAWLTRKEYTDSAEKKRDFWIGVGLFFGVNILLGICSALLYSVLFSVIYPSDGTTFTPASDMYTVLSCVLNLLPWVINGGLIIYFALTRSQIALGMVAGFGAALAIVICLGAIFMAYCFYALGQSY
jgi:hypothetical protein